MAGDKSNGILQPSFSKANSRLAKSKKDAKFTEAAPVTENSGLMSSSDADDADTGPAQESTDKPTLQKLIVLAKSRKVLPKAGGINKIRLVADDGEKRREIGDPGVAVPSTNRKLRDKNDLVESRRLWWEQTEVFAHRWGGSDESEDVMEWVNQYYPKTHWKTRKALEEKGAKEETDSDDEEDGEKKVPVPRQKRRQV
ncbi:uncharacterized protein N0V89_001966 [Didymosphaeria variabile]|uniref:Uncharacterized protein n=1 Tax=Didymosphaeria variabile TaxID=1932322 RepID=A0A9W8XR91_9PLEO|nr:uncharacterized protein N0V89_001966 [Didymosphaeria variabile]KAJ4357391.1 hypothetical protein N0V89_001966 [Didymosphaeria variabile]